MKQGFGETLKMLLSLPKLSKQIQRLQRKEYPVKSILDILQNDENTHTIVYTSPEFQPCSETFSDKYAFVGPSIRPVTEQFQKKQERLIYISMGTVNNAMMPLYNNCIAALKDSEFQVVMSVGHLVSMKEFGILPETISIFPQVDQIALLQQADVFISHCGMNSVSESLYFGVPLVMLPQTAEQRGVSERVRQLGAGIRLSDSSPSAISEAIHTILSDNTYHQRAATLAEGFKQCSGAKGAADKIMQVCENGI